MTTTNMLDTDWLLISATQSEKSQVTPILFSSNPDTLFSLGHRKKTN